MPATREISMAAGEVVIRIVRLQLPEEPIARLRILEDPEYFLCKTIPHAPYKISLVIGVPFFGQIQTCIWPKKNSVILYC